MDKIIQCGKCKHWIPGYIVEEPERFVSPRCGRYEQMVGHTSTDYCSLAEEIKKTEMEDDV